VGAAAKMPEQFLLGVPWAQQQRAVGAPGKMLEQAEIQKQRERERERERERGREGERERERERERGREREGDRERERERERGRGRESGSLIAALRAASRIPQL